MLFSEIQNGVDDCKGASVHTTRGPRHVGGKMLLRIYSGLSGSLRIWLSSAVEKASSEQQAAAGADQPPQQRSGDFYPVFRWGLRVRGGLGGHWVQKNERALLPEGATT